MVPNTKNVYTINSKLVVIIRIGITLSSWQLLTNFLVLWLWFH